MGSGFFPPPTPISAAEIARLTGAVLRQGDDASRMISGIAPLDAAGPEELAFFDNRRFSDALARTAAGACLCLERDAALVPATTVALVAANPHLAFAAVVAKLYPAAMRADPATRTTGISPAAHVDPSALIEDGAIVEPGGVVGPGAEIGRGTIVGPGAVVGPGVRFGRDGAIRANASIFHALVGNRVTIFPGARIGQDGFGFVPGGSGHTKIPQVGRVIIQDDVEIGANTTIDRGSIRDTIIGEGTKIDNLVQIAHNVVIGRHCLIAGQVGISGSVTIGDFVMLGGNAGIRDNVTIGSGARIAAAAAVHSNIPAGEVWGGYPALRVDKWRRQMRAFNRLAAAKPGEKEPGDGE